MKFFNIAKQYFREKPTLDEYIAAHEPKDIYQVEHLIKQWERITYDKNFWGTSF